MWHRELKPVLCDNLEGWDGVEDEGGFRKDQTYVHLWLICVDVWERPTKYWKAIILQLRQTNQKVCYTIRSDP